MTEKQGRERERESYLSLCEVDGAFEFGVRVDYFGEIKRKFEFVEMA